MTTYEGKTAVVTGGSGGLGLATAELLVAGGARVIVTGRTAATLDRAAERLGPDGIVVRSDTSSPADIDALADQVAAEFGALDLLFVNAAISRFASLADTTEEMYDDLFAVNAKGSYFMVQKLSPLLKRGGAVVISTSVADVKGLVNSSAYAATKGAVRSMVRSFARDLQPQGIRVNAVSPGPIDTGVMERALPADVAAASRARLIDSNPMGRFGEPIEVARAVAFLAFDATYTTGCELTVDGGAAHL